VTIGALAATAGVTSGAVYHHFANKEALFEAVFDAVESELAGYVAAAAESSPAGESSLLAGCYAYIRLASVPSVAKIVLIDAPVVLGPSKYRSIDERHFLPMLTSAIASVRPHDSDQSSAILSRAIFAALCELALEAFLHPDALTEVDAAIQTLMSVCGSHERLPDRRQSGSPGS
jgi:AcrR family transcriptional regulator